MSAENVSTNTRGGKRLRDYFTTNTNTMTSIAFDAHASGSDATNIGNFLLKL